MNTLMSAKASQTMSSREIAEITGSTHDNVLKTIRALIIKGVVSGNETPYTHPQNGQTYAEFQLDYRNTMVVVSGYSVELRARIIDRWQELETQQQPREPNRIELARWVIEAETRLIESERQLAIVEPKAQAYDNMFNVTGSLTFRTLAKDLNVNENVLRTFLKDRGWMQWIRGNMVTKNMAEQNGWAKTDSVPMTDYDDQGNVKREYLKVTTLFTAAGMAALEMAIVKGELQTKPAKKHKGKTL